MIGKVVSHYRITAKLGEGGMGAVYLAEDEQLDRTVAIKFLPGDVADDPERIARFRREARSAARLKHPNIVTIHEFGEADKTLFIVMEHVEGETLTSMLANGPLPVHTAIDICRQLCDGLGKAHDAGVIHRDMKPDNVIIDADGRAKILDFGVARFKGTTTLTGDDRTIGTVAYMSPEQATGGEVDHRSDIFSLGSVLYEMLVGKPPFGADHTAAVMYRVVHETPDPLPADLRYLDGIVSRAMAKAPDARFRSAAQFAEALGAVAVGSSEEKGQASRRAYSLAGWVAAVVILFAVGVFVVAKRPWAPRWDDVQSLARVRELADAGHMREALALARTAPDAARVPDRLWRRISTTVTIHTDPSGALVSVRPWNAPGNAWTRLGESPLDDVIVPAAVQMWRVEKEGYPPLELAYDGTPAELVLRMARDTAVVNVPGGRVAINWVAGMFSVEPLDIPDYAVDRKEVTNRAFREFVDAGGYKNREYWDYPFVEDGRELEFDEAMSRFVDATGRPGPSTWHLGKYEEGRGEFPVAGVSWFEAAAYAKFAGRSLPTLFHWVRASGRGMAPALIPVGNFGGDGPRPVDSSVRPGAYGLYDMAGNVREWCLNASGESRFILGGGWNDPSYMFIELDRRSPFDRSPSNGIRCVDYSPNQGPPFETTVSIDPKLRDVSAATPASDVEFQRIVRIFDYAPVELDATTVTVDETPSWTRQRVEYNAGYDDERMFAWLFLPKSARPPYQVILLFPGSNALDVPSSESVDDLTSWDAVDFVVEEGRAVLCPAFNRMYERRTATDPRRWSQLKWRDLYVRWSREVRQSIDYLVSRDDIDNDRIAYYGSSMGAIMGSLFLAIEPRFRTAIFRHGGIWVSEEHPLPEQDVVNFAPRVKVPVLMMNGRYDSILPPKNSQRPLFDLLGSPPSAKRYVLFDAGHDFPPRNEAIRETLNWLDTWMGEVQ